MNEIIKATPEAEESGLVHFEAWKSSPAKAAKAANEKSITDLQSLVVGFIAVHGKQKTNTSQNTLSSYKQSVKCLVEHWQHVNLLQPTGDDGAEYVATLASEGYSTATQQSRLAGARVLYKALRWSGALREELEKTTTPRSATARPFENVTIPTDRTSATEKIKYYTANELELILSCEGITSEQTAIVLLGANGGLRVSAMVNLKWKDINFDKKTLRVIGGKGDKDRTVKLSNRLKDALRSLIIKNEFVLPSYRNRIKIYRHLKKLIDQTGVEFKDVHALRHTAGTLLYSDTKDLHLVARHLGHSTLDTAMIYAAIQDDDLESAVASAYDKLGED